MKRQIRTLLRLLEAEGFEFPVAFYEDTAPDLGDVIEADAFDVPAAVGLAVSQRLGAILWSESFGKKTVLTGVIDDRDSGQWRARVPGDAVWYWPARAGSRARES